MEFTLTVAMLIAAVGCSSDPTVHEMLGDATRGGGGPPVRFAPPDATDGEPVADTGPSARGADDTGSPPAVQDTGGPPPRTDTAGCTPSCATKQCGDDGCGGSCGACAPGKTCEASSCVADCGPNGCDCDLPKVLGAWGSHMTAMSIPTDPSTFGCDANADGVVDAADGDVNDVIQLAADIGFDANTELVAALEEGKLVALLELEGYGGGDAAGLQANILVGETFSNQIDPSCTDFPGGGSKCSWLVDPKSFDPETCEPYGAFANATVAAGSLSAGPANIVLPLSLSGVDLDLAIGNARLHADVSAQPYVSNGRVCGTFPKAALVSALDQACDVPEPAAACDSIGLLGAVLDCDPCTLTIHLSGVPVASMSVAD